MLNTMYKKIGLGLAISCGMLQLSSCSVNPATGSADVVFSSEASEIKKGREAHEKILESTPLYQDEKLNAYVNGIGQKLAAVSDRPDIEYQFFIVDSPQVNAFALPGGYIYINRGLIAFLENEAQLAAILGHEIAHVTARHAIRQESAKAGAKTLSIVSAILTGSAEVGEAAGLYATAAVSGYGRDMELEADGFGAKYLSAAGYPAKAMFEVIGILKDHEVYQKRQARASGRKAVSYHGVFSTHPRSDKRLQKLINTANADEGESNTAEFRKAINGMVFGNNSEATVGSTAQASAESEEKPKEQRYRHSSLGFSFAYPDGWTVQQQSKKIEVKDENGVSQLSIGLQRNKGQDIEGWLRQHFKVKLLRQSEPLYLKGLSGHSGIIDEASKGQQRIAAISRGSLVYTLSSAWQSPKLSAEQDKEVMDIITSFRPERRQRASQPNKTLHFVKANSRTRFDDLARQARLGRNGADLLRIINGYYPSGEPRPGDVIKIIQ
ncbi:M48 family metalloprotease [Pseudoteredinibacter isoporae]|uniref:Putative Zn-dependent protease n=1 Tax=Pseudoteredinibacter isoporae TaxID=570281 RepID=A0A7X0MWP0_9GAMM|nr:M48 family metalloprotease [Pseudoteredinibacter isoporae]MBB6522390.1 putative Zn-dependent protease [Pseudoteredinibacter isoporae]